MDVKPIVKVNIQNILKKSPLFTLLTLIHNLFQPFFPVFSLPILPNYPPLPNKIKTYITVPILK